MHKLALSVGVAVVSVFGWTQLSLGVGGCGPTTAEGEGEGEGEGDEVPETAGGVTFSNTVFQADHTVGTTECPQEVESFTVTNGSGEDRVINFVLQGGTNLAVTDDAGGQMLFASLGPDQSLDLAVAFLCTTTTSFEEQITASVTEADAVTEVGSVILTTTLDISGG